MRWRERERECGGCAVEGGGCCGGGGGGTLGYDDFFGVLFVFVGFVFVFGVRVRAGVWHRDGGLTRRSRSLCAFVRSGVSIR